MYIYRRSSPDECGKHCLSYETDFLLRGDFLQNRVLFAQNQSDRTD